MHRPVLVFCCVAVLFCCWLLLLHMHYMFHRCVSPLAGHCCICLLVEVMVCQLQVGHS